MPVDRWEFLVEDRSMEVVLLALLPKLLGPAQFAIYAHDGKHKLLARLPGRLRAYRCLDELNTAIVILVDQDKDDCQKLKQAIERAVRAAGLATLSDPTSDGPAVAIRIVVEELES